MKQVKKDTQFTHKVDMMSSNLQVVIMIMSTKACEVDDNTFQSQKANIV